MCGHMYHKPVADIDECEVGRQPGIGHYCPTSAECINTEGGFDCQCPENYTFVDRQGHTSTCEGTYIHNYITINFISV